MPTLIIHSTNGLIDLAYSITNALGHHFCHKTDGNIMHLHLKNGFFENKLLNLNI